MNKKEQKLLELQNFFVQNPVYLKWGKEKLACKLDCSVEDAKEAMLLASNTLKSKPQIDEDDSYIVDVVNKNESTNTTTHKENEYDEFISSLDIDKKNIKSTKFWQTQSGEPRFSVVTEEQKKEDLLNKYLEAFKKHVEVNVTPYINTNLLVGHYKGALLVYMSDKHVGLAVPETAMYKNNYGPKEFEKRMKMTLNLILYQANRFGKFEKIIICDLGDGLDGFQKKTTRGGHSLPQNLTDEQAFDVYAKNHIRFFDSLVEYEIAENIEFVYITDDNHSGSFGYFANRAVEIYLNARHPSIKVTVADKFVNSIIYKNHCFMLCHGKDREDRKNGLPLTLDEKTDNYIRNYIEEVEITSPNKHFIKGDLHQASSQLGPKFRYRNVLSMSGASKWIMNNFFNNTPAGISMDIVDNMTDHVYPIDYVFNKFNF